MDKQFYKKLFKLALPITIQALMLSLVAVADALMLGNIEQNEMSAVSLATQVQFIQNILLSAATAAGSVLAAQYWGKNDKKTLLDVFNLTLKYTVLICIIFFAACELCPGMLMSLLTNDAELMSIGCKYLRIAGWSYLLVGISQSYLMIMKVSDHTKQAAMISSGTVVVNIVFNAIFIYGLLGCPRMEAEGAALSTVMVRIAELACCILLSLKKDYIRPDILHLFRTNKLLRHDYNKCMLPLVGAGLLWGVGFASYTAFMGHLGTDAAAAASVAAVVRDCVCCATDGFAVAGGILIGNELGAGNLKQARKYGDRLVKVAFTIGSCSTAVMLMLTPFVIRFVKLTDMASRYLTQIMIVVAVYMIGRAVNTVVINGVFAAGGDTLFDVYSLVVTTWFLAVPLAALGTFVFHWAPVIVYACTCLDEVGKIPWVMLHYRKYKWVRDLTRNFD